MGGDECDASCQSQGCGSGACPEKRHEGRSYSFWETFLSIPEERLTCLTTGFRTVVLDGCEPTVLLWVFRLGARCTTRLRVSAGFTPDFPQKQTVGTSYFRNHSHQGQCEL
ncbi:hypothetical protein HMPREF0290_1187 [Corynebacterium efficiens YS-314]|nr:hypothetical protein HMPREF0290_1187 [Corynebacterium efficiens YS-314]